MEKCWEKTVWAPQPPVAYVNEYSVYAETYQPEVVAQLESLYETALKEFPPDSIYRKRLDYIKGRIYFPSTPGIYSEISIFYKSFPVILLIFLNFTNKSKLKSLHEDVILRFRMGMDSF